VVNILYVMASVFVLAVIACLACPDHVDRIIPLWALLEGFCFIGLSIMGIYRAGEKWTEEEALPITERPRKTWMPWVLGCTAVRLVVLGVSRTAAILTHSQPKRLLTLPIVWFGMAAYCFYLAILTRKSLQLNLETTSSVSNDATNS
jgi:hypothetical protein